MKTLSLLAVALCFDLSQSAVASAQAQDPLLQRDQQECEGIAMRDTGFNPAAAPPAPVAATPQVAGSGSRVRGAAAGALIGGAAGDAGAGAAAGAVAGGVAQRSRNRRAARAQNDANAKGQQMAQANYNNALTSCLESRGHKAE